MFFLVTVVFALGASTVAFAGGKGGSTETGTIAIGQVFMSGAAGTTSVSPSLGASVNFSTTYSKNVKNPRIDVTCFDASGAVVYAEAGSTDHVFVLGGASSVWNATGGPANCTARLFDLIWNGNNPQEIIWLDSTSFSAVG
jgi:hypothetical protein